MIYKYKYKYTYVCVMSEGGTTTKYILHNDEADIYQHHTFNSGVVMSHITHRL